jgi:hypothetical protein
MLGRISITPFLTDAGQLAMSSTGPPVSESVSAIGARGREGSARPAIAPTTESAAAMPIAGPKPSMNDPAEA